MLRIATILTLVALPALAQDRPLQSMLQDVPVTAEGTLVLFDTAAIRSESAEFVSNLPELDKDLVQYTTVLPPSGFDVFELYPFHETSMTLMGFDLFELDQVAGWGELPEAPVIIRAEIDQDALARALYARDFDTREVDGIRVFHRQNDFELDFDRVREDPFSGGTGVATRFAWTGEQLFVTRSFASMERLIAGGASIASTPDIGAILDAAYAQTGVGQLISVIYPRRRPLRRIDPSILLRNLTENAGRKLPELSEVPHLPPIREYALMQWQDGLRFTAAIAIPYVRRDTAQKALDTFETLLPTLRSTVVEKTFGDILPEQRRFEVVETEKRHVLLLMFERQIDPEQDTGFRMFTRNPKRVLIDMWFNRDLDLLLSGPI